MSGTKHTPGPWHAAGQGGVRPIGIYAEGEGLNELAVVGIDPRDGRQLANARLIAAAPKMFAALAAVKALWDKHGLGDDDNESEPVYRMLCAALAKAKGGGQ